MPGPSESEEIWNEAMALLLEWQAAPDSKRAQEAIRRFCKRGPEYRSAWDEAKRVYRFTGDAVGVGVKAARRNGVSRRRVVAGISALALGTGVVAGPGLWRRWQSDVLTDVGEIRRFQWTDGSWFTLGPDSGLQLNISEDVREITLVSGMAMCELARDSRACALEAGLIRASIDEGAFELKQSGGRSMIGVEEGRANVRLTGSNDRDVLLQSGEWINVGRGIDQVRQGRREKDQTAMWRQKMLVADNEQVGFVVSEIARWHKGRVVIPESGLSSALVSGLFDLRHPDAALAAVVGPHGGKVRHLSPWLTVLTTL